MLPTDLNSIKEYVSLGESDKVSLKKLRRREEIAWKLRELQQKIQTTLEHGNGPARIIIYSDGPDAAGKTSTGKVVVKALEDAGFASRITVFKAPSGGVHWLRRFYDEGTPKEGELVFWDRGPAGDAVYGGHSPRMHNAMAFEFNGYEARLQAMGILLVKM